MGWRLKGGILAAAVTAIAGYQDTGSTRLAPWPPLKTHTNTRLTDVAVVAPCAIDLNHTLEGDAITAIDIYRAVLAGLDPECTADESGVTLSTLFVTVADATVPNSTLGIDESYSLTISSTSATLSTATYIGALRGLETFSQLIVARETGDFVIPHVPWAISEHPSFPHRGVMLDPARTFIPIPLLEATVDALLFSKMNVLHLHLTDSQAIAIDLPSLPSISRAAAYSETEQYNATGLAGLVEYARVRGVRVIPELDSPGHARSWGLADGYKDIVACADVPGGSYERYCAEPPCGQLNPAAAGNRTYDIIQAALTDIADVFPDSHMHLGYDEVNFQCWEDDDVAGHYMETAGVNAHGLLTQYFTEQRRRFQLAAPERKAIYWEEVALQGLPLSREDIVQVWSNKTALATVLEESHASVIISWAENYYLDCGRGNMFGDNSWCDPYKTAVETYAADPLDGIEGKSARVLGGEALLWGELVAPTSVLALAWPRAAGYGGRLWNNDVKETNRTELILALQAHADRLQARGIPADRVTTRACTLEPHLCFGVADEPAPPTEHQSRGLKVMLIGMAAAAVVVVAMLAFGIGIASAAWRYSRDDPMKTQSSRKGVRLSRPLLMQHHRDSIHSPALTLNSPSIPPDRPLWDEPLLRDAPLSQVDSQL